MKLSTVLFYLCLVSFLYLNTGYNTLKIRKQSPKNNIIPSNAESNASENKSTAVPNSENSSIKENKEKSSQSNAEQNLESKTQELEKSKAKQQAADHKTEESQDTKTKILEDKKTVEPVESNPNQVANTKPENNQKQSTDQTNSTETKTIDPAKTNQNNLREKKPDEQAENKSLNTGGEKAGDSDYDKIIIKNNEFCDSYKSITNSLEDLNLEVKNLITAFGNHIKLYQTMRNDASTEEQKDEIVKKEKKYLDDYLPDALLIPKVLTGLQAQINQMETGNCYTYFKNKEEDKKESKDNHNLDKLSINVMNNADTLIEMILNRYRELGIKLDQKLMNLV